jgi:hypothetical protein
LKENIVDHFNPRIKLNIMIEKCEGKFNGSEWRHFQHILQQIIMSRGEKAAEVILIEKLRSKEISRMKTDFISEFIKSKLKNQYKELQNEIRPDMAKMLSYSIISGNIKLFNQNKHFSTLDIKGIHGKSLIYSNRESK